MVLHNLHNLHLHTSHFSFSSFSTPNPQYTHNIEHLPALPSPEPLQAVQKQLWDELEMSIASSGSSPKMSGRCF